jgi:hypothetical protein
MITQYYQSSSSMDHPQNHYPGRKKRAYQPIRQSLLRVNIPPPQQPTFAPQNKNIEFY